MNRWTVTTHMVPGPEKRDHELGIQFGANHENPNHFDIELTMFQPNSSVVNRRGRCTVCRKTTWVAHHSGILLDM